MDLITLTFGHTIAELTYQTIEDYFRIEKDEGLNLEFKAYDRNSSFDSNLDKLLETVCAFLNSEGGVIVWGAPKTQKNGKRRHTIGDLQPIEASFDLDDITRKITSRISSPPGGIRIEALRETSKSVLLIEVQKSEYRPHQLSSKGVYYMRVDANNFPGPHYFVEALMKRITYPDVRSFIEFEYFSTRGTHFDLAIKLYFKTSIRNLSQLQNEEYPNYWIYSDSGSIHHLYDNWPDRQPGFPNVSRRNFELLHYGEEISNLYYLGIFLHDLQKVNNKIRILIKFAGRFSPMKGCLYQLDLSFFDNLKYAEDSAYDIPQTSVTPIKENVLWTELDLEASDLSLWSQPLEYA